MMARVITAMVRAATDTLAAAMALISDVCTGEFESGGTVKAGVIDKQQ